MPQVQKLATVSIPLRTVFPQTDLVTTLQTAEIQRYIQSSVENARRSGKTDLIPLSTADAQKVLDEIWKVHTVLQSAQMVAITTTC